MLHERTSTDVSLAELEKRFILSRMNRACSPTTIIFYKRSNWKLNHFAGKAFAELYPHVQETVLENYPDLTEEEQHRIIGEHMPINVLETDTLQSDYMRWMKNHCNEQTIKSYLRGYRVLAYFAMDEGLIRQKKITVGECALPIKNCYTDAEIGRLLNAPDKDNFINYRNWVIINFLLSTGCRVSTLIDVNIGDIDFDEGMLNLNRQKNKNPVRVPMVRKLAKILSEYLYDYLSDQHASDPLFPRVNGTRTTENAMKKSIADYNKSRKVQKTSIHLFRHTFAKNWILNGGDLITLQRMLNHKSLKMVQHYANLYGTDIKPQAEQFAIINQVRPTKNGKLTRRK